MTEKILRVTLTPEQKRDWLDGNWGACFREDNKNVARAFIELLEEGIEISFLKNTKEFIYLLGTKALAVWDDDEDLEKNKRATYIIPSVVKDLLKGNIPTIRYDWRNEEELKWWYDLSDEEWSEVNPYYDDEDDE